MFLFRRERNEPMTVNQEKFFPSNYINQVGHLLTALLQSTVNMFKVICIFGHVLTVNSRCYVKKLIPLSTFLKFHAHVEVNSARLFQNVRNKCSRVLNLAFSRKSNFS